MKIYTVINIASWILIAAQIRINKFASREEKKAPLRFIYQQIQKANIHDECLQTRFFNALYYDLKWKCLVCEIQPSSAREYLALFPESRAQKTLRRRFRVARHCYHN